MSYAFNLPSAKHIVKHAIKNKLRFDNVYPDKPRWSRIMAHPRDWFFWGQCAGGIYSLITLPFMPIFYAASVYTAKYGSGFSGTLLLYMRLELTYRKSSIFFKIREKCYKILENRHGKDWLKIAMKDYFKSVDHPNRLILED
jgi:hypothetical protein